VKSHDNAALNPKAHLRNKITEGGRAEGDDDRRAARAVRPAGGVSDERGLRDRDDTRDRPALKPGAEVITIKALEVSVKQRRGDELPAVGRRAHRDARTAGARAYAAAGITDPRNQMQWPRCTTASRSPRP
jgi:acetyl-CoA C-acetyltransferase